MTDYHAGPLGALERAMETKAETTDERFTNARTPTSHAASHATGGSDQITPASIGAEVADADIAASRVMITTTSGWPEGAPDPLDSQTAWDVINEQIATYGTAATKDVPSSGDATSSQVVKGDDTRLSDARTPTAHTHPVGDITATGTASSTTYLRGDGTWATPAVSPLAANLNAANYSITAAKVVTFNGEVDGGSSGSSKTVDFTAGQKQKLTLSANCTLTFTPAGVANVQLKLVQDSTGGRTVTWPSMKWAGGTAPTLTTAANGIDIISLYYDGTTWFGQASLGFA